MYTQEQILAAQKANVETMMAFANTLFSSSERLIALNLNTARGAFEDGMSTTKSLLDVKTGQYENLGQSKDPSGKQISAYGMPTDLQNKMIRMISRIPTLASGKAASKR